MSRQEKISNSIWYAIAMIVIGACLLFGGVNGATQIVSIAITVIGVILIVLGILNIVHKNTVYGIIELIVGILVIVFGWTMAWIALIVLAVIMVVYGIQGLIKKNGLWASLGELLVGILILLVAFGNHFAWSFVNVLFIIAGALMIV